MHKRVSIRKVSELAGVSVSSASLVFNGRGGKIPLTQDTIDRVLAAARQLDYRPNRQAQNLRSGDSSRGTLGLILSARAMRGVLNRQVLAGVCEYAARRQFQCLLSMVDDGEAASLSQTAFVADKMVDGVMAIGFESLDIASVQGILRSRVPLTCVHVQLENDHDLFGYVMSDDREGGRLAARCLLQAGHSRIAFLGGAPDGDSARARLAGVREVAAAAGLPEPQVIFGDYASVPPEAVLRLLRREAAPTGLIACSDLIASWLLATLPTWGFNVPEHISVVGYDDDAVSQYLRPALTTIRQDGWSEGQMAAEVLIGIVEKDEVARRFITLTPQLVERASVAACAAR